MKVKYFKDADTLYISLNKNTPIETKEFNNNLFLELGAEGNVVALPIEHAKQIKNDFDFSYETVSS